MAESTIDIMYVNTIHLMTTVSRKIKLRSEHALSDKTDKSI